MSVWVCCPSARPVEEVAKWAAAWRERGYKVAILRDHGADEIYDCDLVYFSAPMFGGYPGYAQAANRIIAEVRAKDLDAEWFIAAGDDIFPDPNHTADEIARECRDYFGGLWDGGPDGERHNATFGVMQPTGDRWGEERHGKFPPNSAYIDRVAGSAWIGREFAKRVNQGKGPLWPEYFHMGVDEELQAVATKLGVFWQRPDLAQHHQHWARRAPGGPPSVEPAHLKKANSAEEWSKYKALYLNRERAGFPGSELLA